MKVTSGTAHGINEKILAPDLRTPARKGTSSNANGIKEKIPDPRK
jgi:hypothetical protein